MLRWTTDLGIAMAAPLLGLLHASTARPEGAVLLVLPLSAAFASVLLHLDRVGQPDRTRPWSTALSGTVSVTAAVALAWLAAAACGEAHWRALWLSVAIAAPAVLATRALLVLAILRGPERRIVLVGPLDCRLRLREHLAQHPELACRIVAEVGPGVAVGIDAPTHGMAELETIVAQLDPDEVLLSTGFDDRLLLMEAMARLLTRPLIVRYVPDPDAVPLFCPRPADIAGLPAIDLSNGPLTPGAECLKWIEDKTVAMAALAILGGPMLLIALAIRITSPGPALFVQERQGRFGRPIRVYKFRTMRIDQCSQDPTTGKFRQAGQGDARITALGRFLRNTSLDELPQFLNVLFGDMSVVGPRPHVRALNRRFANDIGELMRRHYVKPGITGLAQISGARGETRTVEDMRRRVNLDLEYLRGWSLWLDISIIARTLVAGWINRHP